VGEAVRDTALAARLGLDPLRGISDPVGARVAAGMSDRTPGGVSVQGFHEGVPEPRVT